MIRTFVLVGLVLILATLSCVNGDCCDFYEYKSQFHYQVRPSQSTTKGIAVDLTGQDVSLEVIDRLTDEVEACLKETFGVPPILPEDVRQKAQCRDETFNLPIARKCLVVKIPDDWEFSCDKSQQVLPIKSTSYRPLDALCEAKGLEPTPECPCRWRAGIQDDNIIVATPSLYLYKDPLIRLITGCNNPWGHPALSHCAAPSTPPL